MGKIWSDIYGLRCEMVNVVDSDAMFTFTIDIRISFWTLLATSYTAVRQTPTKMQPKVSKIGQ